MLKKNKSIVERTQHKGKSISILFYKNGFSFCTQNSKNKFSKINTFYIQEENNWEQEVLNEINNQLLFKQEYQNTNIGFLTSFFNIVPASYIKNNDRLLDFSEADFDDNYIIENKLKNKPSHITFGISQSLNQNINQLFKNINLYHSGKVLIDSIQNTNTATVHLNQTNTQLEITVLENTELLFYNIFEIQTREDILFFTLYVLEQLSLDSNQIKVYTYGELLVQSNAYQMLRKYIRNILPAIKDEEILQHYLLYKLFECE